VRGTSSISSLSYCARIARHLKVAQTSHPCPREYKHDFEGLRDLDFCSRRRRQASASIANTIRSATDGLLATRQSHPPLLRAVAPVPVAPPVPTVPPLPVTPPVAVTPPAAVTPPVATTPGLEIAVHLLRHRRENARGILKSLSGISGRSLFADDGEDAVLHLEGVIDVGLQLPIDLRLAPFVALDPLGGIDLGSVELILEGQLPARLVPVRRMGQGRNQERTRSRDQSERIR